MTVLIKRRTVKNRAYELHDADQPNAGAFAIAMRSADGWKVAARGGRMVGERLDGRTAAALATRTAHEQIHMGAVRALLGGAK
ncbi:hypothetical protein O7626_40830 [Micromonospora sp. WMMD1102]|uniref:hypothetical protein n=1 Tax=Micromonospora sp. WMMD1102 TaxID=3016105 RepID=UPI002414E684|nr:hypothetical protein [Micromonospora sp. WMMD1102]MDG4790347.1 hypothetical protein [Micromonospora sp. WMMD1102]MDG4792150.1 hypothetical protein [Micromonospora sp. WMMD1102]